MSRFNRWWSAKRGNLEFPDRHKEVKEWCREAWAEARKGRKTMKLRLLEDNIFYWVTPKGSVVTYVPWKPVWEGKEQLWQNMTEAERVSKGIYVMCYGWGEWQVFVTEGAKNDRPYGTLVEEVGDAHE